MTIYGIDKKLNADVEYKLGYEDGYADCFKKLNKTVSDIPQERSNSVLLEEWLIRYCQLHDVQEVPRATALQRGPNSLRTKKALDKCLVELTNLGRCREVIRNNKKIIEINSDLLRAMAP